MGTVTLRSGTFDLGGSDEAEHLRDGLSNQAYMLKKEDFKKAAQAAIDELIEERTKKAVLTDTKIRTALKEIEGKLSQIESPLKDDLGEIIHQALIAPICPEGVFVGQPCACAKCDECPGCDVCEGPVGPKRCIIENEYDEEEPPEET